MKNTIINITIIFCAVFFCATNAYSQSYDTCTHLKVWAGITPDSPEEYKLQYDTIRLYIERCAAKDDQSWDVFVKMTGAVSFMSDDTTRFVQYRNWLIAVLYLNTTNPAYFCACMGAIASTYQYGKYHPLGYLAVLNYFRQNHPECWSAGGQKEYSKDSTYDAGKTYSGYDVNHLPPLDSLGLGFLLHHQAVAPSSRQLTAQYLASFTSSPNPFINETTLQFTLNRMTYTTIAVYDELGRLVWGDGRGASLEAGVHTIHLDGKNLPSGTLYARISTGFGEVKTVKLVHEK